MDSQLGQSKHYGAGVLLAFILIVIAILILWAIFRKKDDKNHHHRRSHSSDECDRSEYTESRRYSDSSASRQSGSH